MKGNSFELDVTAIRNGAVVYQSICYACNTVTYKPVAGKVKGINTKPNKPADQVKWLIDAEIVLEADLHQKGDGEIREIAFVKQYFTINQ